MLTVIQIGDVAPKTIKKKYYSSSAFYSFSLRSFSFLAAIIGASTAL